LFVHCGERANWLNIALGIIGALVGGFLFNFFGTTGITGLNIRDPQLNS